MAGKTHRIGPSIIDTAAIFATDENCHKYLEMARWPDGVTCLKCGHAKVSKYIAKGKVRKNAKGIVKQSPDRYMYQCLNPKCKYSFATTTGTIFSDTHLPLNKWMMAVALMCNAKKGLSAKQMERDLGVSYKTAWYLNHRIRKAMDEGNADLFDGTVECDETFVTGRYDRRRKREQHDMQAVFGAIQRNSEEDHSKVRAFPISPVSKTTLTAAVKATVSPDADLLITDSHPGYKKVGRSYRHEIVNHSEFEYVRKGDPRSIHTNSIESFWSNFKRGLIGSFHQVSVKHLQRYLHEFSFRFNNRRDEDIFSAVVIGLVIKDALRYKALTAKVVPPASPSISPLDDSDVPF